MSRKLFTAGCVVLILTGLVHLLGHYQLVTNPGETDHDRQLLALMRANPQDMGLGMMRTMFDFLAGFSLTFAALPTGMGLAGFVVRRHAARAADGEGARGLRRAPPRGDRSRTARPDRDRLRHHLGRDAGDRARLLLLGA